MSRAMQPPRLTQRSAWRSGRRCRADAADAGVGLPAALAENHHRNRSSHDDEIFSDALAFDVLKVVANLGPNVVNARIISLIHLSEAGNPRARALTQRVLGDVIAKP